MKKKLVSLNVYNYERAVDFERTNIFPQLNGIACPNCGKELYDSDYYILTSNPPKKNIHCEECGFKGYRLA